MSPRLRVAAVVLAAACVAGTLAGAARRHLPLREGIGLLVVGSLFVVVGVIASTRRPRNLTGALLALTGLAWLASGALTTLENPVAFTLGLTLFSLGLAPLGHLAVAFPAGRLTSRLERALVAAPYALAAASVPVVKTASCEDCRPGWLDLDIDRGAGRLWYSALLVGVLVTTAGVLVLLVRRWRAAGPAARRVLLPVVPGACVFAAIYIAAILAELGIPTGLGDRWAAIGLALIAGAPLVFLGGLLRARLARAGVGELVVELGDASSGRGLRDALAGALGDPGLTVAYCLADGDAYVDPDGTPVQVPPDDPTRATAMIERGGRRVGALIFDAALRDDPALVDAVAAAAGLAMENERLHVEVLARLADVRASRARIVEAADAARRRVERDLHDGAQQRLVSLTLAVGLARSRLGPAPDPALDDLLGQASEQAGLALRELRTLAQGLHPALLGEAGLAAAVDSLTERCPVPVEVSVDPGGPVPAPVEAAAYFVVSEALANVAKHAHATAVTVRISRQGLQLVVEVADDGGGGARLRPGSGLEGLADRVAALDGRLRVGSPPDGGTSLRVELPCG